MIAPETTALILLAAGTSSRFGRSDKLAEMFCDQPLGMHVVTALEEVPFASRIAVRACVTLDYSARGYRIVDNGQPEQGMSRSIRLGVEAARRRDVEAVLIVLADMPRITAALVCRLFDAAYGPDTIVASSDGVASGPPALLGAAKFDALVSMQGDAGARGMVRAGRHIVADCDELIDIDTQADLEELVARFR